MTEQAKPGPDYSGQKLAGRSFRGQDLRGAVFRNTDLRGVDFRGEDLTGADFSGARMGKTWRRRLMELPVQFLLGVLLGFSCVLTLFLLEAAVKVFTKTLFTKELTEAVSYYWALLPWLGLQLGFVWAARHRQWERFLTGVAVLIGVAVAVALVSVGTMDEAGAVAGGVGVLVMAVVLAGAGVVGIGAGVGARVGAAGVLVMAVAGGLAVAVAVAVSILANWWLSRQAIQYEVPELDWLRRLGLRFRCGGGTDFRGAMLTDANFSNARLDYTRFASATLDRTRWRNAINLHLANT